MVSLVNNEIGIKWCSLRILRLKNSARFQSLSLFADSEANNKMTMNKHNLDTKGRVLLCAMHPSL